MNKQMGISAIQNGTVIDHIKTENTLKVLRILKLRDEKIMVGVNFDSKKLGKKGLIKISDKILDMDELNKITFVSPYASITIIKDFKIVKKSKLTFPNEFIGVAKCINPNCITNHENIKSYFITIKQSPTLVKCKYCEKIFGNDIPLA